MAENGHKFSQLQEICLGSNKITDAGLKALAENGHKFSQLEGIYLKGNKISSKFDGQELKKLFGGNKNIKSVIRVWC